jgi:hemerythrin superfamily protein
MDATSLLIADHNRVKGLIARYKDATDATDEPESHRLASLIAAELRVHTTIEEKVFYPAVFEMSGELAGMVEESVEEHHVVDVLLAELRKLEAGSDGWVAKMTVLIENVEHHVEEEETKMFPKVRSSADEERREELGRLLEEKKAALGAPTVAEKLPMSKSDLVTIAREQQIPGRSSMNHEELAATVGIE